MKILIIGGTNIDIYGQVNDKLIIQDSNNGKVDIMIGGVGKNIAENLARLDLDVTFATALGNDSFGKEAKTYLSNLGVNLIVAESANKTPIYLAVFDEEQDMFVGINDMSAVDDLNENFLSNQIELNKYDLIVIDANLSEETIEYICNNTNKPIYAEAISTKKVMKFKPYLDKITAIKCNFFEARKLSGSTHATIKEIMQDIYLLGVKEVYLTDGGNGSYHFQNEILKHQKSFNMPIVNASGAGDAFFSGVIYALINQKTALIYGNALASITLMSRYSNNPHLSRNILERMVKENENWN